MYLLRDTIVQFLLELFYASSFVLIDKRELQYLKQVLKDPLKNMTSSIFRP